MLISLDTARSILQAANGSMFDTWADNFEAAIDSTLLIRELPVTINLPLPKPPPKPKGDAQGRYVDEQQGPGASVSQSLPTPATEGASTTAVASVPATRSPQPTRPVPVPPAHPPLPPGPPPTKKSKEEDLLKLDHRSFA